MDAVLTGLYINVAMVPAGPASEARSERRRSSRVRVAHPVRLRPADASDPFFEELQVTTDAGSGSFSFTTTSPHYYMGMRLKVTLPYTASLKVERAGRIVRVQMRGKGYQSVVVELEKAAQ